MTLDFSNKGRVVVKMHNYMLNDAPASMDGKAATPAAAHLFKVNTENPKLLGKNKKELFCTSGNARPVPQPAWAARHQDSYLFPLQSSDLPR